MVTKEERNKMRDFVASRIEDSKRYIIERANDSRLIITLKDAANAPATIFVDLINKKISVKEYEEIVRENWLNGIWTCPIFYKDGKNFHVRLGARGNFKGNNRSLKEYSNDEINEMIHLRGLEKSVLKIQKGTDKKLTYFQPETARLSESIRWYKIEDIILDYSHLEPRDPKKNFAREGISMDYKIAKEVMCVKDGGIGFKKVNQNRGILNFLKY